MMSGPSLGGSVPIGSSNQRGIPATPPPSHSPGGFMIGSFQSRAMGQPSRGFPDLESSGLGGSQHVGFRTSAFGVVGGSVTGPPPPLDISEFPSLGGSADLSSQQLNQRAPNFHTIVKGDNFSVGTASIRQDSDFKIQEQDFPALPGAPLGKEGGGLNQQPSSASTALNLGANSTIGVTQSQLQQQVRPPVAHANLQKMNVDTCHAPLSRQSGSMPPTGTTTSGVSSQVGTPPQIPQGKAYGIQSTKEGLVTNIPQNMVKDQFGMIGFLQMVRTAQHEPKLTSLAMGTDLMGLGLNLNSAGDLCDTWSGPWSDKILNPVEIDRSVPAEYLVNHAIREKLLPIRLSRFGDDLLFYLFYFFPNDMMQLAAATELFARDWRYHKENRIWITRHPQYSPQEKTAEFERGTYFYFDVNTWRKAVREFTLHYDRLEGRPTYPS